MEITIVGHNYSFSIQTYPIPEYVFAERLEVEAFHLETECSSIVTNVNGVSDALFSMVDEDSEISYDTDNPRFEDKTWDCANYEEASTLAKGLIFSLLEPQSLAEIEAALDKDRVEGEWRQTIPVTLTKRYAHSDGWDHIYEDNDRTYTTRWVFDVHHDELIAAQQIVNSHWVDLTPHQMEDLQADILCNQEELEKLGAVYSAELPDWATQTYKIVGNSVISVQKKFKVTLSSRKLAEKFCDQLNSGEITEDAVRQHRF